MLKTLVSILVALVMSSAVAFAGDPVGRYSVIGSNPGITLFNLFPEAGTASPQDLFRQAGNGVLITEIMGLHTVDPVSGDLSVGASGVRIRDGVLAEAVDKLTFAGNLKDFLTRIVALGNDLRWYGSSAGLSILLEDIALGGA